MENEAMSAMEKDTREKETEYAPKPSPIPFLLGPSRGYLASGEKEPKNLKQAHSAALRYIKRR